MKNKIKLGFLAWRVIPSLGVHRIASSMHGRYKIIGGCFNPILEKNMEFAESLGLN